MIAIDIPMPKSCCDCPCFDGVEYLCAVKPSLKNRPDWIGKHRHPDCPLLEVDHIRDKTMLCLHDVYTMSGETLDEYMDDFYAKRLGKFIFDHPELLRKDYSDDLDSHVRNFVVDCFVVRINKKKGGNDSDEKNAR